MNNKFHITDSGPKKCTASVRDCPIGGTHFETKAEAEQAYEFKADKKFSPFDVFRKHVDPFTKHITEANKHIESLEDNMKIRDQRQIDGTLYHEMLADGVTAEELEARFQERVDLRMSGLGYIKSAEGSVRAIGLSYGGDYKAEEEYGISEIAKSLRNGEYSPDDVVFHTEDGMSFLTVRGARTSPWTKNPVTMANADRAEAEARRRFDGYAPYEYTKSKWQLRDKPIAELRAELKGKIVPLPKTKERVIDEILKLRFPDGGAGLRTPAVGEFQNGTALAIATKDPLEAKMMKKLKESHDSGNLRLGNTTNPFGGGVAFYDDRDLTREHKSSLIRAEEASKASKAYIAETKNDMRKFGSVFAVSPRVDENLKDVRESSYWLNFSPNGHSQIFGFFNKTQLDRMALGDFSDADAQEMFSKQV